MAIRRKWIPITIVGLFIAFVAGWGAVAAGTWVMFGRATETGADPDTVVAKFMPKSHISESHEVEIDAPAAATWKAMLALDLQESRTIRTIFRARELLLRSSASGPAERRPLIEELRAIGWRQLAIDPGHVIVLGTVTQPWHADVTFRPVTPESFAAFETPDYVKILVLFAVDSLSPNRSRFRTETVAWATDDEARAKFRKYWSVFSPGILLIRREALPLVKQRAETMVPQ